ncbi:MAG: hypothetical protein WC121_10670 [Candidatus Kapaibacterium sp.]
MKFLFFLLLVIIYFAIKQIFGFELTIDNIIQLLTLFATSFIALFAYRIQKQTLLHQQVSDTRQLELSNKSLKIMETEAEINKRTFEIQNLSVIPIFRLEPLEINDVYGKKIQLNLEVISEIPIIVHELFIEELSETKTPYKGDEVYNVLNKHLISFRGLGSREIHSKGESMFLLTFRLYKTDPNETELISKFCESHQLIIHYSSIMDKNFKARDLHYIRKEDFRIIKTPIDLERMKQFLG